MPGGRGEDDDERSMFAEEMIAMRNQRGWTQEETAAQMLVSTSTIANIESGYRAPTPAQATKADEVFGTPGTFQRHERRMRGIPFSVGFRPFQPHEAAARLLYRNVGGPAVMAQQMEHLVELAMMPRVSIQVIPADRPHAGLLGAFVVAENDQPTAIVYLDSALDGQVVESAEVAEGIDVVFRALQMEALTGSASLR
jgi:transcriptional regulator with XRE-family HTH domain